MKTDILLRLAVAAALLLAVSASAAPSGEDVIHGDVTFNQDGSVTLITASDGAIIEYESFDIFANEVVQFIQPSEHARVLNRVFGDATKIEGSLLANGIVYIVNPAGIFIDGDAFIEVGGLVAASGHISNEDFLAGIDAFDLTGPVTNQSDEVHGDVVALLGSHVANHGEISAPDGTIALVAGERVVLARLDGRVLVQVDGPPDLSLQQGVVQAGLVDAGGGDVIFAVGDHYSLAINHEGITRGGSVELRGGDDGLLLGEGGIGGSGERGGSIDILGDRIAVVGATLDASGESGGGRIHLGGQLRGAGASARRTWVDADSVLRADALTSGDGGEVVVWGDEAAVFEGTLSARGGDLGGDGGFAEISSLGHLASRGSVDLGAAAGRTGTLLFDPTDIVIEGGFDDGDDPADLSETNLDPTTILAGDDLGSDPFTIFESEIEATNANIELDATNSISVTGDFLNPSGAGEPDGTVVLMAGNSLTLRTRNAAGDAADSGPATPPGIDLGGTSWQTSGGGSITLATGTAGEGVDAGITAGNLTTDGGSIDVSTTTGTIDVGDVSSSGVDGAAGGDAGSVRLAAVDAGDVIAGDVSAVGGTGASGAGGNGATVSIASGDGSLDIGSVDASGGDGASAGGSAALSPTTAPLLLLQAGDTDASGTSEILVAGDLSARGGVGADGDGGNGAEIALLTIDGGDISVGGDLDSSGGAGSLEGGGAGRAAVRAFVSGNISVGDVFARGGAAGPTAGADGGGGGSILMRTPDGSITTGSLDASGAAGSTVGPDPNDPGLRGASGDVELRAGFGLDGTGDITIAGTVTALDGTDGDFDVRADGMGVILDARGDIEFVGVDPADAHIHTTEDVGLLAGGSVGENETIRIDAFAVPVDTLTEPRVLQLTASDVGRADVTNGAFNLIQIDARSAAADFRVTQVVGEAGAAPQDLPVAIEVVGDDAAIPTTSTLVEADTRDQSIPGGVSLFVFLSDSLDDVDDEHLELVVAPGAIQAGGSVLLNSEDDVVLVSDQAGPDPVHAASFRPPDASDPSIDAGSLFIITDADADGDGSVVAMGPVPQVDMNTDGVNATGSLIFTGGGVGDAANPLRVVNASALAAGVVDHGGIHVVQTAGGDLTLRGGLLTAFSPTDAIVIGDGDGNIDIENQTGNVLISADVSAAGDGAGGGGTIRLAATGADTHIAFTNPFGAADVDAAGDVLFDGALVLTFEGNVRADGDVTFAGTVDSDLSRLVTENLNATSENGVVRFRDDVGGAFQLRNLVVDGTTEIDPLDPVLDPVVDFTALQTLDFNGDVRAAEDGVPTDDAGSMRVVAGTEVTFGGDIGTGGRLLGVEFASARVVFDAVGSDQSVVSGVDGILFEGLLAPPAFASVGKEGGGLRLESVGAGGSVDFGANQKLTVDGVATLVGETITTGDVNAEELVVEATDAFFVRARAGGQFFAPGAGLVPDTATDLVANLMSTTVAPQALGSGGVPRIATLSGSVDGAGSGSLPVIALSSPLSSADLVATPAGEPSVFFDLAVGLSDPGNETEREPPAVVAPLPARPGDEASAGSAAPPGAEAVLEFLRCADSAPERPRGCAPQDGSPLDSERGEEIARRYARLFGGSGEAAAARRILASGAPERPAVLRDTAAFLAQLRLLGMDDAGYERVRDQLLRNAVGADRSESTLSDVQRHARGMPL